MEKSLGNGYTIDDHGCVFSTHKNAFLKPTLNEFGYHFYTIYLDGKQKCIMPHIEMWRNFIGEIPAGGIRHKDGNKMNNELTNLEARHPTSQYIEYVKRGISITKIARFYKLPKKEISKRISAQIPGGIRKLRQQYPLNKSIDIT